jgi:hypothetical protein
MGYFAFHNGTSTFDRNWAQASYLDQMEANVTQTFTDVKNDLGPYIREETSDAEDAFYRTLNLARNYYNEMDWSACYESLNGAQDWIKRMYFSTIDITPPLIDNWTIIPEGNNLDGFEIIAEVFDDNSGIENVTVHIEVNESLELTHICEYDGLNWSCDIEPFISDSDWRLWIEAWDWGMNLAISNGLLFKIEKPPEIWGPTLIIGVTIISALAVVVFVYRFYFRSRENM